MNARDDWQRLWRDARVLRSTDTIDRNEAFSVLDRHGRYSAQLICIAVGFRVLPRYHEHIDPILMDIGNDAEAPLDAPFRKRRAARLRHYPDASSLYASRLP